MNVTKKIGDLNLEIEENGSSASIKLSGDVNEHFRFQNFPEVNASEIIFDMEHVASFNSCGIREWINLISDLNEQKSIKFEKCSIITIDQINMVPDVAKGAEIVSFFAPYFCENDEEVSRLIVTQEAKQSLQSKEAPALKCDICDQDLEFDAMEESYFLFLDNIKAMRKAS